MKKTAGGPITFSELEMQFAEEISQKAVLTLAEGIGVTSQIARMFQTRNQFLNTRIGSIFKNEIAQSVSEINLTNGKTCIVLTTIEVVPASDDDVEDFGYRFIAGGRSSNIINNRAVIYVSIKANTKIGHIIQNPEELMLGIKFVVAHEMTHIKGFISETETSAHRQMTDLTSYINERIEAGDVFDKNFQQKLLGWNKELFRKYVNSPSEMKSRQREILENIALDNIDSMRRDFADLRTTHDKNDFILNILSRTSPFVRIERLLTPKNRREILRNTYMFLAGKDFLVP